jgi:hypothetical protein
LLAVHQVVEPGLVYALPSPGTTPGAGSRQNSSSDSVPV